MSKIANALNTSVNDALQKAAYSAHNSELFTLMDKFIASEETEGESCYIHDVIKWLAAFDMARMIKESQDKELSENNWKSFFNYEDVKECLACASIDFDSILTNFGVTLT